METWLHHMVNFVAVAYLFTYGDKTNARNSNATTGGGGLNLFYAISYVFVLEKFQMCRWGGGNKQVIVIIQSRPYNSLFAT